MVAIAVAMGEFELVEFVGKWSELRMNGRRLEKAIHIIKLVHERAQGHLVNLWRRTTGWPLSTNYSISIIFKPNTFQFHLIFNFPAPNFYSFKTIQKFPNIYCRKDSNLMETFFN